MFGLGKMGTVILALSGGLVLAGCAKDNTAAESSTLNTDKGVICTKCQTTWVQVEHRDKAGQQITYFTPQKRHVCPDCKDAVANFFATGNLQKTCKTCGDSMEICEGHHH